MCCKVRGDLLQALSQLALDEQGFDAVIIELTGLADPAPVHLVLLELRCAHHANAASRGVRWQLLRR